MVAPLGEGHAVKTHRDDRTRGRALGLGRGDRARRKIPMSPEELLEAEVLIYLRGLGFPIGQTAP